MNISESILLTRKDIARMLPGISVDQVRKNEERWGLQKAKIVLNDRCVRYRRAVVIAVFKERNWLFEEQD